MQLVFAIRISKVIVNNLHNKFLPFLWDPLRKEYHIEINKRRNNTLKIKIANIIFLTKTRLIYTIKDGFHITKFLLIILVFE